VSEADDELDEVFDPNLAVDGFGGIGRLTGSIAVDPQSGSMLD
jgi:hypothetical protein